MANILYGVNGEGSGHSTRAREVITCLQGKGHVVKAVSFDRGLRNLKDSFDVTEIYGLRFSYVDNRVRYRKTVAGNLFSAPRAAKSMARLMELSRDWDIDLVITDFEPLSCRVGRRRNLPVISIDNQHCLTNTEIACPRQYRRDAAAARLVTRMMTPGADAYLVTTFFTASVKRRNTFLFPPILRREVLDARPEEGEHVLVYVTSPAPSLARLLKGVRCRFIVYGFNREGQDGNLVFRKPSTTGFLEDLVACKAVIANAGFSLVSEALHLGKPYLAVPVRHQFEQTLNAYYLDRMGYGAYWEDLNRERVESFLFNVPAFREKLAEYPRQDNSALFEKLDALIGRWTGAARPAGRRKRRLAKLWPRSKKA